MSYLRDNTIPGPQVRNRLAEIRQQRGMAAAGLARQAGVSRQTIYAMEAGNYVPNTAVALRLARALEVRVEELFRLDAAGPPRPRTVRAELAGSRGLFAGSPIQLCRVGGRLVGVPAVPAPWQLPPADALVVRLGEPRLGKPRLGGPRLDRPTGLSHCTVQLLRDEDAEGRLLVAGCDPAASVLARHLQRANVGLVTAPVNSSVALRLLKQRMVHVAGTHLKDEDSAIHAEFPKRGVAVFAFAVWEEGLVLSRGNPKKIRGVPDLARAGVRLVNREKGSGARQLLDGRLKAAGIAPRSVSGYHDEAPGHLAAAWRVHMGLADCCVATRSAARAFGLDFLPLTSERYDMVIRKEHLELAAVERLLDTLTQAAFRRELDALCGYDTRETGRRIT
jgi:molybdate-binding protein/DNA-binding XRE family transcriptional regulator